MLFNAIAIFLLSIMGMGLKGYAMITKHIKKKPLERTAELPSITIIIPAYNEEKIIEKKIENTLSLDYPKEKMEIVIVDNGDDSTYELAKKFPVTTLKSERGKIKAMNKGLEHAKTEVIVFTDADTLLESGSIKSMASLLTGNVGLVNGYTTAEIPENASPLMKQKLKYKTEEWELRHEEGLIDSICNAEGRLMMLKKSIVPKIPEEWLTDDYAMTFFMRGKGYRLVADKEAKVTETLPATAKEEIRQFKRYASDILITNFRNINFLFNPKYGYFGMMTFPFRRFFPLLYPLFILYFLACLYFINPLLPIPALIIVTLLLFAFNRLMLIRLWAVILAYANLHRNTLTGGKWKTSR